MASKDDVGVTAESKARIKDAGRDSRLSFRNFAEHQMRREFKGESLEVHCAPHIKAFAECAEEKGLMVVWSCRGLHKDFNKCMETYNSNEAWERYKTAHADELEKRVIRSKPN
jgi:hypothetical protein